VQFYHSFHVLVVETENLRRDVQQELNHLAAFSYTWFRRRPLLLCMILSWEQLLSVFLAGFLLS